MCLDAFRGAVVLAMWVVNDISEMPGIPAALQHAAAGVDTLTLADLVFPGFLFLVGVAIPASCQQRRAAGHTVSALLRHIILRTSGLLFIGLMLTSGNAAEADTYHGLVGPIDQSVWFLLFCLAVIGLWTIYPAALRQRWPRLVWALRATAGAVLVLLLPNAAPDWLMLSRWDILYMIGWSYAFSALVYLGLSRLAERQILPGLIAAVLACTAFYSLAYAGWWPAVGPSWLDLPRLFGSQASVVLAGVVVGQVFLELPKVVWRVVALPTWAAGLLALGALLRPLQGANKILATSSYGLLSAGLITLGFLVFYLLIEVGRQRWLAALLAPIGANALLAYLMPDLCREVLALLDLDAALWPFRNDGGLAGIINALLVAALMGGLTAVATRRRLLLRL